MNSFWLGILVAGILAGSFVIPSKKIRRFGWDQTWLVFCVLSQVVLPLALTGVFAPGLFRLWSSASAATVLMVVGAGAAWGVGAFLFGRAIPRLGFALANAIVCGVVTLVGSVSPLLIGAASLRPGQLSGLGTGLGLLVAGISACAWASILRDRGRATAVTLVFSLVGLGVAVASGVLSAMLNTGFAYGGTLISRAVEQGTPPLAASLAVWVPVLLGGFLVNFAATAWKIQQARAWDNYRGASAGDWLRAFSLGLLWFGALLLYGISSRALGEAGTVYGFAVYGGVAILTSTAWGLATGEWQAASLMARLWLVVGAACFVFGFATLATQS